MNISQTAELYLQSKLVHGFLEKQLLAQYAGEALDASFWKGEFEKELVVLNEKLAQQKKEENPPLTDEDMADIFDTDVKNIRW